MRTEAVYYLYLCLSALCAVVCISMPETKVLVFFPGVGFQEDRLRIIRHNLRLLRKEEIDLKCLMITYASPPLLVKDEIESFCDLNPFYYSNYAAYLKTATPSLLEWGHFTHVFLLLDDVELDDSFKLIELLSTMQRNNLSVASPAIFGSVMGSTVWNSNSTTHRQFPNMYKRFKIGHQVEVIEFFATLFTLQTWKCLWSIVDPTINSAGWGYDTCLLNYCKEFIEDMKMGVANSMFATHDKRMKLATLSHSCGDSCLHPTEQKDLWIKLNKDIKNISLIEGEKHHRGSPLI